MAYSEDDKMWMLQAIGLAERGLFTTTPNPRVGCVIVSPDGTCVGKGYHRMAGGPHAEIEALRAAGDRALGATVFVTLEPCNHKGRTSACSEALIAAGVSEVVFGMLDPNPLVAGSGLKRLRQAGVQVRGPVLEEQCRALNPGFIKRMTSSRPYVRCKVAASLDGRTAMSSGESQWITGGDARNDVQFWRAQSCAVVTGVSTVVADDPSLTVRIGEQPRQPLRVILDSHLRTPPDAKILLQNGDVAIATCAFKRQGFAGNVQVWGMPSSSGRIDLEALLDRLAAQQCNEILVESGPTLAGAFIDAGLVDELIVYLAPKLLGNQAKPMFELPLNHMREAIELDVFDVKPFDRDWRFRAKVLPRANTSSTRNNEA